MRIPSGAHTSLNWPYIATADANDASDLEPSRFPFDDQRSGCRGSAEPKNHRGPSFALMFALCRDAQSCIPQNTDELETI